MRFVWSYFTDLHSRRSGTGYGPLPIQYSEILAYFNLYGIEYNAIEINLIETLDNIAMEHFNAEAEKQMKKNK